MADSGHPVARSGQPVGLGSAVLFSAGVHLAVAVGIMAFPLLNRSERRSTVGAAAAMEVSIAPPAFQQAVVETPPDRPEPQPAPSEARPETAPLQPKILDVPDAIALPPEQPPRPPVDVRPPPPPPPPPPPVGAAQRPIASAPTVGAATAGARTAQQNWEGKVLARLEQKKRYPAAARRDGLEDIVYVRMTLDRKGNIVSSSIVRSKGFAALDDAVTDLVKRADPLPALPDAILGERYTITVPVDFFVRK